jgi:hypothetical protein
MAWVAVALAVSGGFTAYSQIERGRQAKRQSKDQERIAQRNALIREQDAEAERVAARTNALQIEREGDALKARQRALFAKSGVETRGTPLAVLVETAQNIEADKQTILRGGEIRGRRRLSEANIFRAQGSAARARGSAASRASILSAVGTGIGTTSSLAELSERRKRDEGNG